MWTRWVALVVVLGLAPGVARAEERQERGFLTGLGISLLAVGLGGAGLGVGGLAGMLDAQRLVAAFRNPLPVEDVPSRLSIEKRATDAQGVMTAGFIVAGVGLAGAIVCLMLDMPKAPVQVSVLPTLQGGAVSLSLRF